MTITVMVLAVLLAAVNGGNDVAKGVAIFAGSGVTRYRTAVGYGTATTLRWRGCRCRPPTPW